MPPVPPRPPAPPPPPGPAVPRWRDGAALPLALARELLEARGCRLTTERGQHFLVEPSLLMYIVRTAELAPGEVVLEIGPGLGALTGLLLESGARVLAVELDRGLHELCAERFAGVEALTLLHADAMAGPHALNPELERALRNLLAASGREEFQLVANLPYSIATPLVLTLAAGSLPWSRMVVTIQRELAERLAAPPGTAEYGAPAVLLRAVAELDLLRVLAPAVFWPPPRVESAIVEVRPLTGPAVRSGIDRAAFSRFVQGLFAQRRKTLAVALRHLGEGEPAWRRAVEPALAELGLAPSVRAETLAPETFEVLFGRLLARAGRLPEAPGPAAAKS